MTFTKDDTCEMKGLMILLLVFHHCFYAVSSLGITIHVMEMRYNCIQVIAVACRMCVMAFLIMSGYGIYKSVGENTAKIYKKFLPKLYLNYLFIVVVTLIITLFFQKDFPELYDDSLVKVGYRLVTSITGTQYWFASGGINMTWWFVSFLLVCYCAYPLITKGGKCFFFITLLFVPLRNVDMYHIGIFGIMSYLSAFSLGIVLAKYEILENWKWKKVWGGMGIGICLLMKFIFYKEEVFTYYIDLLLIVLLMRLFMEKKKTSRILKYFGKISMDIYYMHYLFIFYISITNNFIYQKDNFIIIYLKALAISIVVHYVLVAIRKVFQVDKGICYICERS